MKRFAAVLLFIAVLFGISACNKVTFDQEEYESQVAENESKQEESSIQQEADIAENMSKVAAELGSTEENRKIVIKWEKGTYTEYDALYFDKKGEQVEYRMTYRYYLQDQVYEAAVEGGDVGNDKLESHDDYLRLTVYKNKNIAEGTFDEYLKMYQRKDADICQVV